jgi:1,4-dihydroxy-6-naphthoate synthase
MLRSGGALGRGCGPLVIARPGGARTLAELEPDAVIAVPGEMTTAFLLLQLALKRRPNIRVMRFDEIVTAVAAGTVAAGLIIHESRFTYMNAGLIALADLGEWWERTTGHPIPLGVILMQRTYHEIADTVIDDTIRRSLAYAYANPERIAPYIREHAFEMDEQVMRAHIALYVNEYSVDIGPAGEAAIRDLFGRAQQAGLLDETTPVEFSRPPAGLSQAGAPS